MCTLNPRSRLVLAKLETTQNTNANPVVGTDDLFVSMDSAGISLGVSQIAMDPASPTGYQTPAAISTIKPTATYRIPLYGKGKDGGTPDAPVLPRWLSVILASCGHVDRSASTGTKVVWTPDIIYPRTTSTGGVVAANKCSFTLYDYLGREGSVAAGTKVLVAMTGCRVAQVRLNLTVGQWAFLEVDIQGLGVQPVAVTTDLSAFDLDDVVTDFVRVNGAQSTFNDGSGAKVLMSQSTVWTVDFGAVQEEGDNTEGGVAVVGARQAIVTGSLNPIQGSADIATWSDAQWEQTLLAYAMAGSMTPEGRTVDTGWTLKVAADAVQIVYSNYDNTGSVFRLPMSAMVVSDDGVAPPLSLTLS